MQIYENIAANHGNFHLALNQLGDLAGRRMNFASAEEIGDGEFEFDLDVVNEEYVDGYAKFRCRRTRRVKNARLFGVLHRE